MRDYLGRKIEISKAGWCGMAVVVLFFLLPWIVERVMI